MKFEANLPLGQADELALVDIITQRQPKENEP
jgi:hypothetical protein